MSSSNEEPESLRNSSVFTPEESLLKATRMLKRWSIGLLGLTAIRVIFLYENFDANNQSSYVGIWPCIMAFIAGILLLYAAVSLWENPNFALVAGLPASGILILPTFLGIVSALRAAQPDAVISVLFGMVDILIGLALLGYLLSGFFAARKMPARIKARYKGNRPAT